MGGTLALVNKGEKALDAGLVVGVRLAVPLRQRLLLQLDLWC
jgi:hypothetical protein